MALSSNQQAILTARFGAARFGAARFAFCPKDTMDKVAGPRTRGPFYVWWKKVYPAAVTWTVVKA